MVYFCVYVHKWGHKTNELYHEKLGKKEHFSTLCNGFLHTRFVCLQ